MAVLRAIGAELRKDLRLGLADRPMLAIGILLPLNLLVLFMLFVTTGGRAPTDVVLQDTSPAATAFVAALEGSRSFTLHATTPERAQADMASGRVVAVITVPAGFGARVAAGTPVALPVEVNNLETDYTNDIRRAVPLAITSFYADQQPGRVVVHAHEVDVQPADTGYVGYLSISLLALGLMIAGVLQGAISMSREYESGTMKELLMAPSGRWPLLVGKLLAAFVIDLAAAVVLIVVIAWPLDQVPRHPVQLALDVLVVGLSSAAIGLLLGAVVRRRRLVLPLAMLSVIPLFIASGPFGPPNWEGPLATVLATVSPVTYAIAAFQGSVHGYRTWVLGDLGDSAVLVGFCVAAVVAAGWVVNHRTAVR